MFDKNEKLVYNIYRRKGEEDFMKQEKEKCCHYCGSSDINFMDTAILKAEDGNYYYYELYFCQKCGHIVSVPIKQVPTSMVEGLVND